MTSGSDVRMYAVQQAVFLLEVARNGTILETNNLFNEYMAYQEGQLSNKHIRLLFNEEEGLPFGLLRALKTGQGWHGAVPVMNAFGDQLYAQLTLTPVIEEANRPPTKFICVGYDITAQRRQKSNLLSMIKQERVYTRELEEAKADLEQKVEEKVHEIKDSIRYSERIQKAMLPETMLVRQNLPKGYDMALMYFPRDIVSGDFYWAGQFGGEPVVAVGDGTGHGIPGAFMSILGINAVSKFVEERGITSPASLLNEIDLDLRMKLNQSHDDEAGSVQDSIDMVVLRFLLHGRVEYASAMSPLYHVNTKNGMNTLHGTKRPLGGTLYNTNLAFEQHRLQLEPGDTLYLMSDGYVTQLGERKGRLRPFGRKNMRALMEDIQQIADLKERLSVMEGMIKQYRGTQPQTDDLVVMAIRYKGE